MQEFASYDLPFTREGGWGYGGGEQSVGAPGDATVLASNMGGAGVSGLNAATGMTGTTGNGLGRGAFGHHNNNVVNNRNSNAGQGFGTSTIGTTNTAEQGYTGNTGVGVGPHNGVGAHPHGGLTGHTTNNGVVNPGADRMV